MITTSHYAIIAIVSLLLMTFTSATASAVTQDDPDTKPRLKVALVLGGGGAKGAAEVGVLKYIEKSGIPIDYVVGTSIGSIVGGLYSMGYTADQLDSLFVSQEWSTLLTDRRSQHRRSIYDKDENGNVYILGIPVFSKGTKLNRKFGALHGDSIVSMLSRMTACPDSINFDEMPIPYRCVAVDISHGIRERVLSSGNLAQCMRASMAIPLALSPVQMDDMILVDGGVLNNLPVDVARDMGADIVIAVDLTQNKPEDDGDDDIFSTIAGKMNVVGWALNRPDQKKYNKNRKDADLYINPRLKGFGVTSFSRTKISQMIYLGEEAGASSLKALKKLKKKIYKVGSIN